MKYTLAIFQLLILASFVLLPIKNAYAQELNGEISCHEYINDQIGKIIDPFLKKMKISQARAAYNATTTSFKKSVSYKNFKDIIKGGGFENIKSYDFLDLDTVVETNGQNVTTVLLEENGESHLIIFGILKEDDVWKIDAIYEAPAILFFKKTFPARNQMQPFIKNQLELLQNSIERNRYNQFYNTFAKSAKSTVKRTDIKNAFAHFRNNKLDISIPENAQIIFGPCVPEPNDKGVMLVNGSYKNEKFVVTFKFQYTYEWVWKLSGFNITADPIAKEPPTDQ